MLWWVFFIAVDLVVAFIGGSIWQGKGGSYAAGFVIALFASLLGLILLSVMQPSSDRALGNVAAHRMSLEPNIPLVVPDGRLRCRRCRRINEPGRSNCVGCGSAFSLPVGAMAPPATTAGGPGVTSDLERLGALFSQGLLSQEEFDAAKTQLLS